MWFCHFVYCYFIASAVTRSVYYWLYFCPSTIISLRNKKMLCFMPCKLLRHKMALGCSVQGCGCKGE